MLTPSARWKTRYPAASIGVLAMNGVSNPAGSPSLDGLRQELETQLRSEFAALSRSDLRTHPMLAPYTAYYKRFDKTYHVQQQLESVVWRGKTIPHVAALVEAMFMAELKNLLLTAGHDLDSIDGDLEVDVASGSERYTTLSGKDQILKAEDMFIHDGEGILSSILYGPDSRTPIRPATRRVVFTVYAPAGISEPRLEAHLGDLRRFVQTVEPEATVDQLQVVRA